MLTELQVVVLSFLFGACIGSFLHVVAWRLPREQAITGRSQCPHCKHTLSWYELVPLFSFILQRRRCRNCQTVIPWRYPGMEVATAVLFALTAWVIAPSNGFEYALLMRALFVVSVCIVIFLIDLEHYLILDKIVFPTAIVIVLSNVALDWLSGGLSTSGYVVTGVMGGLAAALPFWVLWRVSRGKWMGFGDVKFAGLMGLILGLSQVFVALFLSFMLGAIIGGGLVLAGYRQLGSKIPFGTFLTLGTLLALWWGNELLGWYLALVFGQYSN